MASEQEVYEVWMMLRASYDNWGKGKTDEDKANTLHVYGMLLADIPGDLLKAATLQHIGSSEFFPTVAELRKKVLALCLPQQNTALQAWGLLYGTFSDGRYYKFDDHANTPEFDDPILDATVKDLGGYWHIALDLGNEEALRARFLEGYEARARRARDERMLLPQVKAERDRLLAEHSERREGVMLLVGQVTQKLEAK